MATSSEAAGWGLDGPNKVYGRDVSDLGVGWQQDNGGGNDYRIGANTFAQGQKVDSYAKLGFSGPIMVDAPYDPDATYDNGRKGQQVPNPAFLQWMQEKGYKPVSKSDQSGNHGALVDAQGNIVPGSERQWGDGSDDAFGIGVFLAAAGGGALAAGGAGAGAGGAATSGASQGALGSGVAGYVTPGTGAFAGMTDAQLAAASLSLGGGAAAGAAGGGAAAAGGGGAAAGGGATAGGATAGGGLLPNGITLGNVLQAGGLISGAISASRADSAQQDAINAQSSAAKSQLDLAQQQWDYQKNVYLPKAMQLADDNAALTKKLADKQLEATDYYMGVSKDAVNQAKKSYEFQDRYMDTARDYADGKMANTMADEANADVEQASAQQRGITQRNMERYGINPNSGSGMALMHDDQNAATLASSGAQTMARRMARDKAEQMVGIAAGAGAAGFGTGMTAGNLATGATNSAVNASGSAGAGLNAANNSFNNGASSAGTNLRGAGSTGYGLGQTYGGSPFADYTSGLASGALKSGSPFASFINNLGFGTSGNNYNGSSNNPSAANYVNSADAGFSVGSGVSGSSGGDYYFGNAVAGP